MAYIDVDKARKHLRVDCLAKYPTTYIDGLLAASNEIYNIPAADVVEVVRCRNCKHAYFRYNMKDTLQEIYACRKRPAGRSHKKVSGDFFCARGERRSDNDL